MKKLDKFETERQIIHIIFGLVIVLLLFFDFLNAYSLAVLTVIAFIIFFLAKKYKLIVVYDILERLERKEDLKKSPGKGPLFYLLGATIVTLIFEKDIAMASIVILALGDSIPYLVGNQYKLIQSPFNDKKYLEGSFAGFMAAFLGVTILLWVADMRISGFMILQAFFASLIAMIAEGIDIKIKLNKIDDNIIIPIVASCVIWVIRLISRYI